MAGDPFRKGFQVNMPNRTDGHRGTYALARRFVRKLGVTMAAVAVATAFSACATDVEPTLSIEQAQIADGTGGVCQKPSTRSDRPLWEGILDVALDKDYPYRLYPLLRNNMMTSGGMMRVELNTLQVEALEVKVIPPVGVSLASLANCPSEFSVRVPVNLRPNTEFTAEAEVIRPCHVKQIRALFEDNKLPSDPSSRVIFEVAVRARGQHGSTTVRSSEFIFPIQLCYGCLQKGFEGDGLEDFNFPYTPKCDRLSANPYQGNTCNLAQDFGPVLCCESSSGLLECPGRPRPPADTTM